MAELRERGVAVVPHGVRLSLGGAEPLDPARVTHLAACAERSTRRWSASTSRSCGRAGREAGHLLPRAAQPGGAGRAGRQRRPRCPAELTVPLALEPIAALFDWPDDELTEAEFLTAMLDRTGALLLLDVANVYANAVNRAQDPRALLDRICRWTGSATCTSRAAGAPRRAGLYHDTHTDPVPPAVLALLARLRERRAAGCR